MVINIGELKAGNDDVVRADIAAVAEAAHAGGAHHKVINECCLLTQEEKIRASRRTVEGGAGFVENSTGFSTGGATGEDGRLMRETVGPDVGGGISHPRRRRGHDRGRRQPPGRLREHRHPE